MDYLHLSGIRFIQWLQQFKSLEGFLIAVSKIGSPPMAYALVFPVAYYINPQLGLLTMLCTCFSEWISGILKWVLHGHRPYWWVELYAEKTRTTPMQIEQFPSTCETGPGSPSGHCMITLAAIATVLMYSQHCLPGIARINRSCIYRKLLCILFVCFTILLGLSRLFLAAHFPHQVVAGIISGVTIGCLFTHYSRIYQLAADPSKSLLGQSPISTLVVWLNHPTALILIGFGSFFLAWLFSWFLQNVLGLDINWSIDLAKAACRRSEWVHLSTSLMVGFARIAGYLSGLAIALILYAPAKPLLLRSHFGVDVILLACIAAAVTRVIAEPLCRHFVYSTLASLNSTRDEGGPGLVMLISSIIEGAVGPLLAVWILPNILSKFANRSKL